MSWAQTLGLVGASLLVVLVGGSARSVRRAHLAAWGGPQALLVDAVVGLALVVVPVQIIGLLGWFTPTAVAMSVVASCGIAVAISRTAVSTARTAVPVTVGADPDEQPASSVAPRVATPGSAASGGSSAVDEPRRRDPEVVIWMLALATVASVWIARVSNGFDGIVGVETLRYRLPVAARFVQEQSLTNVHMVDTEVGSLVAHYPRLLEVLHATGMLATGNEFLSLAVNPASAVLLLLAAWCIGRPYGVAPISATGAAVALGMPDISALHPGNTSNDIAVAALFTASVALLTSDRHDPSGSRLPLVAAGLAAGMAAGVKYTFLATLIVLTAAVIALAARGARIRTGVVWSGAAVVGGGGWYIWNAVVAGNPVPPIGLRIGPARLPTVPDSIETAPLLPDLLSGRRLNGFILPGLRLSWGPLWWLTLALVAAGAISVLGRPADRHRWAMGLVAASAVGAYLVIPQPVMAGTGDPIYFAHNLRYMVHGVALLLVLLPTVLARSRRARLSLSASYLLILLASLFTSSYWGVTWLGSTYGLAIGRVHMVIGVVCAALLFVAMASWGATRRPAWRTGAGRRTVAIAVVGSVIVAPVALGHIYDHRRYRDRGTTAPAFSWAWSTQDTRIATSGVRMQYLLLGRDLSNHVQYLGVERDDGGFTPAETCAQWKAAVAEGYDYLVVFPDILGLESPEIPRWAHSDPALVPLGLGDPSGEVFAVQGSVTDATCPD